MSTPPGACTGYWDSGVQGRRCQLLLWSDSGPHGTTLEHQGGLRLRCWSPPPHPFTARPPFCLAPAPFQVGPVPHQTLSPEIKSSSAHLAPASSAAGPPPPPNLECPPFTWMHQGWGLTVSWAVLMMLRAQWAQAGWGPPLRTQLGVCQTCTLRCQSPLLCPRGAPARPTSQGVSTHLGPLLGHCESPPGPLRS